jgi:hypothetical protein
MRQARTARHHLAWLLVAGAALPVPGADTAGVPGPALDATRSTMDKWVETRQLISEERKDWEQARELLNSRIRLVEGEIAQLEERLVQARGGRSEAQAQRDAVLDERARLVEATSRLAEQMGDLEDQVRGLFAVLPEPMQERLRPLLERMPADRGTTKVTVAERFQNVLGLLTEMNKLNSEITVASEVRALSDGKPAEVQTVYVGLGQAYFVSMRGEAGIGRPGPGGWTWEASSDLARDINHVLEILQNKSTPTFVGLPVSLQ